MMATTKKINKANVALTPNSHGESENIDTQRFSDVADFVDSISDDDDSFGDEFAERLQSREVVKTLQLMRIENGTSQAEIADEIGCTQGRISKLESGFDDALKFGDVEAYARVLGRALRLQFTKRHETSVDRIQRFAFCIHHELERMAELANKDHDIANGVARAFGEYLYNQVRLLQIAAEKLPLNPQTDEPYIHVDFRFRESASESDPGLAGLSIVEAESRIAAPAQFGDA